MRCEITCFTIQNQANHFASNFKQRIAATIMVCIVISGFTYPLSQRLRGQSYTGTLLAWVRIQHGPLNNRLSAALLPTRECSQSLQKELQTSILGFVDSKHIIQGPKLRVGCCLISP